MGGFTDSTEKGTGSGNGIGNTPTPGGVKNEAANANFTNFLASRWLKCLKSPQETWWLRNSTKHRDAITNWYRPILRILLGNKGIDNHDVEESEDLRKPRCSFNDVIRINSCKRCSICKYSFGHKLNRKRTYTKVLLSPRASLFEWPDKLKVFRYL